MGAAQPAAMPASLRQFLSPFLVASSPVCGVREWQTSVGGPSVPEQGSLSDGMREHMD